MKVISPFGPKIAKLKFSNKLIKNIKNFLCIINLIHHYYFMEIKI